MASWAEKKKGTEFEQLTIQGQGIMKAEEEAIMTLLTAKTSAIHKVTAKSKCRDCPSNRCPDCPHFGISQESRAQIAAGSTMLPDGINSGNSLRLAGESSDVEEDALVPY